MFTIIIFQLLKRHEAPIVTLLKVVVDNFLLYFHLCISNQVVILLLDLLIRTIFRYLCHHHYTQVLLNGLK